MKQHLPSPDQLKRALAPMSPQFEEKTRALLNALPENREEKIVKKKISAGLVLAIVLVLVTCAVALALTQWREEMDTLVQLQSTIGYYDEWGLDEKLQLLAMMEKNEVEMDEAQLKIARDPAKSESERIAAADLIIAGRYGVNNRIDTVTALGIMETEMGLPFWDWSIEDMAWFSQMELKYQNASPDVEVFTLPKEGEITREEALEKAKAALKEHRQVDIDMEDGLWLRTQYLVYPYMAAPLNQPEWVFTWGTGAGLEERIREIVYISCQGETLWVLHTDMESPDEKYYNAAEARKAELLERVGPETQWSLEDWYFYRPDYYHLPGDGDIAPEKAVALAKQALMIENGMTQQQLEARAPSLSMRLTYVTPAGKWQYIYTVYFTPKDSADQAWDCYVNLYADTGEVQRTYQKQPKN